jgi:hypothetical protein
MFAVYPVRLLELFGTCIQSLKMMYFFYILRAWYMKKIDFRFIWRVRARFKRCGTSIKRDYQFKEIRKCGLFSHSKMDPKIAAVIATTITAVVQAAAVAVASCDGRSNPNPNRQPRSSSVSMWHSVKNDHLMEDTSSHMVSRKLALLQTELIRNTGQDKSILEFATRENSKAFYFFLNLLQNLHKLSFF